MSRRIVVIAAVVIAVAVGAFMGTRARERPQVEAPAENLTSPNSEEGTAVVRASDAALQRRVDALADEVAELREQVAHLRSEAGRASEPATQEPDLTPEQEQAYWDEHMTLVEAGFHEEAVDPQWAKAASGLIQRALEGKPALRAAARSTECRAQTCRVEIETDASGKLSDAVSSLTRALGDHLPTVRYDYVDLPGGRKAQVLYLSRESADGVAEQARRDDDR